MLSGHISLFFVFVDTIFYLFCRIVLLSPVF